MAFLSLQTGHTLLTDYLKQAQEDGFKGIGESHPWAQGFNMERTKNGCLPWSLPVRLAGQSTFMLPNRQGKRLSRKNRNADGRILVLAKELPDLGIILVSRRGFVCTGSSHPSKSLF